MIAVILITAWAITVGLESAYLAVLAMVILVVALTPFWAPTRYALTDDGVEERRLGRLKARRWADLRRVQVGPGAALVSPMPRPSWHDRYRGILLYFDGLDAAGRAAVIEALRARIGARTPAAAPGDAP